jgi:hypothetical protein
MPVLPQSDVTATMLKNPFISLPSLLELTYLTHFQDDTPTE